MKILLTNDDGYDSEGLHAVADLFKDDHEICVVAPDSQKSGFSHSITLKPNVFSCREIFGYGYKVFAVGGSPVDCVKTALTVLFKDAELVISGINNGENLGSDIMYSGTVSAATDAVHLGKRALALSLDKKGASRSEFDACARFVKNNLDTLIGVDLPHKTFLNINFPSGAPIGVKAVKMNTQITFIDLYKFGDNETMIPDGDRNYDGMKDDNDEYFCKAGYITITPLTVDRTDHCALEKLKKEEFVL